MYKLKILKTVCNHIYRRFCNNVTPESKIRNIVILAHIDAGKTTTTERMLYYSGRTHSMGEVHHGNTVTDYMEQERERGITICSSAVRFDWKDYIINLIDTPGHIDFTMEVEQSLSAVDGTVVVLDATAGVEAQTITVWLQADRYNLPRIVYANKMDRNIADFDKCIIGLKNNFSVIPVPLQFPIHTDSHFTGIIDLIFMKQIVWSEKTSGKQYTVLPLSADQSELALVKREEMLDKISEFDNNIAEIIISSNSFSNIEPNIIIRALHRATIENKIVPVILGSSYKNIGVQLLLDAIVNYLPSPVKNNSLYECFGNSFVGKVFKVKHDKQRGPLTMLRVLRGSLQKGTKLMSARGISENAQKIYEPLADEYKEISIVGTGDIAICSGLKNTCTGDILVSKMSALANAKKKFSEQSKIELSHDRNFEDEINLFSLNENLLEAKIPSAVYFCSIEPPRSGQQLALDNALKELQREDPSLRVKHDDTTLQTVLGGMGELHLEIIKNRIQTEYKIDVELGALQIAYKEIIDREIRDTFTIQKEIAGRKQLLSMEMTLKPSCSVKFRLDSSPEAVQKLLLVYTRHMNLIKKNIINGLQRGPNVGGEVIQTEIILHDAVIGKNTADSFIIAGVAQCVQKLLTDAGCRLLEPIMALQILVPDDYLSSILYDLNKRRGTVKHVNTRGKNKQIEVFVPLAELQNYSNTLRSLSSGQARMTMQLHEFLQMSIDEEVKAVKKIQGFI